MPKAAYIFSGDCTEGARFFLYHEEMVDWGRVDFTAGRYSGQPLTCLSFIIPASMSSVVPAPLLTACIP